MKNALKGAAFALFLFCVVLLIIPFVATAISLYFDWAAPAARELFK